MRKDQCLFCASRKCYHRIVTIDYGYDEIVCSRHIKELEQHADETLNGKLRCNIESTGQVKRGEPYPCVAAAATPRLENVCQATTVIESLGLELPCELVAGHVGAHISHAHPLVKLVLWD